MCRFATGLAEAPFFPRIKLSKLITALGNDFLHRLIFSVTSSWYNKEENSTRMAIWHAGNTISNILSGFLAAGILTNTDDVLGLHA